VSDDFHVLGLAEQTSTHACTVTSVAVLESDPPEYVLALSCLDEDQNLFDLDLHFTPSTALTVEFPFAMDDEVTFAGWYDDFPPFYTSYTLHDTASGALRFAWVEGFDLGPLGANDDWSNPVALADGPGCSPDANNTSKQSIMMSGGNGQAITVYSSHAGVLEGYELRVTQATYNPDIEGGCNSCYAFALVGE
jgi:hypothetical protein